MNNFGLFNISLKLLLDENGNSRVNDLAGKGSILSSVQCPSSPEVWYMTIGAKLILYADHTATAQLVRTSRILRRPYAKNTYIQLQALIILLMRS